MAASTRDESATIAPATSALWVRVAGLMGALGVALGAFGAHGLRDRVAPPLLEIYKTGVLYHLIHAVALLAVTLAGRRVALQAVVRWAFLAGIVVFSGTLYLLALTGNQWLGAVTPVGGLAFIVGWAALVAGGVRGEATR